MSKTGALILSWRAMMNGLAVLSAPLRYLIVRVTLLPLLLLLAIPIGAVGAADTHAETNQLQFWILILHSYNRETRYTQLQDAGIRESLAAMAPQSVTMFVEFLDAVNCETEECQRQFLTVVGEKNRLFVNSPDVVITTDTPATQLWATHRREIFPNAKHVYSAVVESAIDVNALSDATGVFEAIDFNGTFELALRLHPHRDRFLIIADNTTHGAYLTQIARHGFLNLSPRIEADWITDSNPLIVLDKLKSAPNDAIGIYLSHSQVTGAGLISASVDLERLCRESSIPIYSVFDAYLGSGVVGGCMASGEVAGKLAGELAVRVLRGEDPATIPPIRGQSTPHMFDARALNRWGIAKSQLPKTSIFRHEPVAWPVAMRRYLWIITAAVAIQSGIIGSLILNRRRRIRLERTLGESNWRIRAVFENAASGIGQIDSNGRFLEVNARLCEIFGYSADVLCQKTFMDITHPDDLGKNMEFREQSLRGEINRYTLEKRYLRGDGTYVWANLSTAVLRDHKGTATGFIAVVEDIGARKAAEDALKEREEKLGRIFAYSAVGIALTDRRGVFVDVNPAFCRMLGYSRDELIGESPVQFTHPDDRDRSVAFIDEAIAGFANELEIEKRYVRKDGHSLWCHLSVGALRNSAGDVQQFVAVISDISARKTAEEAVLESGRRFKSVLENLEQVAVQAFEPDGTITFWNKASEEFYGFSAKEAVGRDLVELLHGPESRDEEREIMRTALEFGVGPKAAAVDVVRKDGSKITVFAKRVLHERPGKQPEFFCFDIDITERKRAEDAVVEYSRRLEAINQELLHQKQAAEAVNRELRQLTQSLEEANTAANAASRAKSEFLANMSHEIRTPMTAILGYADQLLDSHLTDHQRMSAVQTIRRNGDHLLNIINDILDLSRIEAGRMTVEPSACSPREIIEGTKQLLQVRADAKQLEIRVTVDPSVPERIETDPTRFRQIVLNLLGNAIRFTERGSVSIHARFEEDAVSKLVVDVADTGIGIQPEQAVRLFKPFGQADSSMSRRFGGSGLGLIISKRLAVLLGGDLVLMRSVPAQGSLFRLTLSAKPVSGERLQSAREANRRRRIAPASSRSGESALAGRRVLLAEDSPDNQHLISYILKGAGAEVTIADHGQRAVELAFAAVAQRQPFDVILMDMQMPVMDGYVATRTLRDRGYSGLIVAITAHAMVEDRARCLDVGCDEYTTKPIERMKLIQLVLDACESAANESTA